MFDDFADKMYLAGRREEAEEEMDRDEEMEDYREQMERY